jgi:four helix bundle protein
MQNQANTYSQFVETMKARTKAFAFSVIHLIRVLPHDEVARVIGGQLLRAATAVGANYRAACRVRTAREFAAKIRIVCEEADESQYWLELLIAERLGPEPQLQSIYREGDQLTAIFTKALDTTRRKIEQRKDS